MQLKAVHVSVQCSDLSASLAARCTHAPDASTSVCELKSLLVAGKKIIVRKIMVFFEQNPQTPVVAGRFLQENLFQKWPRF